MAKPYSLDFRKKAIGLIDAGEKIAVVSKLLDLAENTLRNWLSIRKETQSLAPKDLHTHKKLKCK